MPARAGRAGWSRLPPKRVGKTGPPNGGQQSRGREIAYEERAPRAKP
jgi:hypothetical protein